MLLVARTTGALEALADVHGDAHEIPAAVAGRGREIDRVRALETAVANRAPQSPAQAWLLLKTGWLWRCRLGCC